MTLPSASSTAATGSTASTHDAVYLSQSEEFALALDDVEGTIPAELVGTVLRNGAGQQRIGADQFNVFDAPGMVVGVTFEGGKARARARHVRHPFVGEELAAGRQLRRRAFTNLPGGFANLFKIQIADPAQHDVYRWGGKLVAAGLMRHCLLDDKTLESRGELDWGVVPVGHQMCQMPRIDRARKRLVGFSQKPGVLGPDVITFWELDEAWRAERTATQKLGRQAAFVHDLAFSPNHYLFVENPTKLSPLPALLGTRTIFQSLGWPKGERARLWLLPRGGASEGKGFFVELPAQIVTTFHLLNAFERDGQVVVDFGAAEGPVDFVFGYPEEMRRRYGVTLVDAPGGRVWRCVVDPTARKLVSADVLVEGMGETPEIHPQRAGQPYRVAWLMRSANDGREPSKNNTVWAHGIARLDVESRAVDEWTAGGDRFVSQPVFVPRPGAAESDEDDGWLVVFALDGAKRRTDVLILDARRPSAGPLATLHLPHAIAVPGTHAVYLPDVTLA